MPLTDRDYLGSPLNGTCGPTPPFSVAALPLSSYVLPSTPQTAYIIHNLWADDFTVSVCPSPAFCHEDFMIRIHET
jgi:hypothetical protein